MSSSTSAQREPGRADTLAVEDYYMSSAVLTAQLSSDPNTQVGACFVKNGRVVGLGCNNFPHGCAEQFSWSRDSINPLEAKYFFVLHAEPNAMLLASRDDIRDSVLYVTLFPCNECAKLIIQSGVKEVIYLSDKYQNMDSTVAAKQMFDSANVKYRQFASNKKTIKINLSE